MEFYLFLAMFFVYLLTALFVGKRTQNKIWTTAFIISFIVTAFAIGFLRVTNQDVMMSADNLNTYYLLYLFGSISVVLGFINFWMYRHPLIAIFFGSDEKENIEDKTDEK